jgi:chromate reductase
MPLTVVGISGSLRKGSFNTATLRAVQQMAAGTLNVEPFDIAPIPLYNEDVHQQGFPPAVADLRARIKAADGLLICTPEYNYSVPGVLKNAIDWASRPPDQPFEAKPIAIVSASPSFVGGARAQYHLRQVFIYLNGIILNRPEVMITSAHTKFDANGQLTDDMAKKQLGELVTSFAAWIERVRN